MSIEPHNVRTVFIRAVMPPNPEAKLRVPPSEAYYAELLAQDAKKVRARHGDRLGFTRDAATNAANDMARTEADAKREALAARIMAYLDRPRRSVEIAEQMGGTFNATKRALQLLRSRSDVTVKREGSFRIWERRQEAAE